MASEEDSEDSEECCDECGREMDYGEAEYGACYDCAGSIKANRVRRKIPSNYEVRAVAGSHRKGCSDCGYSDWSRGDYYVHDHVQPWGADKFCLDCADTRDWGNNSDEDDEDNDLSLLGQYLRQQQSASAMSAAAPGLSNSMFNPACHTGCPGHPTAGTLHIGGLSSAMINPGVQKTTRACTRVDPNGRKCRGEIQSFTESGFQDATCSVCFLPTAEAAAAYNNEDKRKPSAGERDESSEGAGRNKRQRI